MLFKLFLSWLLLFISLLKNTASGTIVICARVKMALREATAMKTYKFTHTITAV